MQITFMSMLMLGRVLIYLYFWNSNGKADNCWMQDVKIDGNRLITLYSIMAPFCKNPFGVVWRLEPGGYFILERMGTDVIRDYWLTE